MDKFVITGGRPLKGTIKISGSKNAVLPVMASTLLSDGIFSIQNVPDLRDVNTMSRLLQSVGASVSFKNHQLHITVNGYSHLEAPYDLVKTMRASIYVLGPMVARFGYAKVSMPGGCAWGPRPVNLHIEGLKRLGAKVEIRNGYIHAKARRLKGAHITFDVSSVGATGNVLMASTLAKGTTIVDNAAREPEIAHLIRCLQKMGAHISGSGTDHLEIEGVDALHPDDFTIIPDRIETATFLVATHVTSGNIHLDQANPAHIASVLEKLQKSGAKITTGEDWIELQSDGNIKPVDITTAVYPGFPTDMQAQWMALMSLATGFSIVTDTIFTDRFTHVAELKRLGADIALDGNIAVIKGVKALSGAPVMSTDLRASASLIIAGLVAKGRTDVSRIYHIDRGYENIEKKLQSLGAAIYREKETLIV
ncbi:MAG: UDP-N-acetylglucosamine 1-carboxyvinyltransferase [Bacteroidetes bacterium RBG_13_42_15]|nr:MAG: UDP-N-acetylglucosamine 1-carboxyvinyltransferase [Bacteroidetes bacterium RBG_13_42_15]